MIQLIYPIEDYAPLIPSRKAHDVDNTKDEMKGDTEYFPVITPDGLVTGMATRDYCHSGSKLLHPVIHLHIINRNSEIYLQKRAETKFIQPGKWDTAVGGHVQYGESLVEALMRESSEELSFEEYNPLHICTYIYESEIEKEFVTVFAAVGNSFKLVPDSEEISEGRFWSLEEIDSCMGKGILTPNFESEFKMIREQMLALL